MTDGIEVGTWVEVEQVVLEPGARAPQVPEDTRALPLQLRVCGRLLEVGRVGEDVEIQTRAGRRLRGRLVDPSPRYRHGFGAPVPELTAAADEARAILSAAREDTPP